MQVSDIQKKPEALLPRQEKYLVFTLAGIQFSHILDFMVMMPLGPVLVASLGIGTGEFALLVAIYTLAAAVSGLVAATFIDFFERKGMLLTLFALFIVATLSCALAPDYQTLLLTRALAGVFGGVLSAMLQTLIGDLIPFERRGRASGTVMSGTAAATVLGVPGALLLTNALGWQSVFVAIAVVALVFLLLAMRTIPAIQGAQQANRQWRHAIGNMRAVLSNRNHWTALLFMFLGAFSTFTIIPYLTLYLTGNVGLSMEQMPVVYVLGGLASFFGARWVGARTDRLGKVQTYRLVALFSIVPILLQTNLPPLAMGWVLLCSTLFFTLGTGRAVPAMAITVSAVLPPQRGTFMSLNAALQQLACGAAAFLGGVIISQDSTGVISGYGMAGWLAVGLTVFTMILAGKIQMHSKPVGAIKTHAEQPVQGARHGA
ncbi:Predicted arabinose efflux permease, MFS family [Methylobacillus rhizosphaerae]|uniref:Predicted arabinose efflux permease, MFS family n=1 Tax=Methylobacillus rhizosphaerae TaxID=551994 RepID=A0A238YXV6_9PROT|nr:MFS transporter [Methylobacillus rhizosphaerae]SNR75917.1 Predicted arabinose efflux permease, MFS family [Methylobacillus rhizosphaerae]